MRASVSDKVLKLESFIKQPALSLGLEEHQNTLMHLLCELLMTIPSYPHPHAQGIIIQSSAVRNLFLIAFISEKPRSQFTDESGKTMAMQAKMANSRREWLYYYDFK